MLEIYLGALETGYYEAKFAFEGLADENVWKRPAEGLLSVGELAGHIAYWEAVRLAGGENAEPIGESHLAELARCTVSSPLIDARFAYYPETIITPPSERHQAMTAEQVWAELSRVHEESVAAVRARNPELDNPVPGYPPSHTYREFLKYLAFHVAYHTGQIYSARHLLGENPPDN